MKDNKCEGCLAYVEHSAFIHSLTDFRDYQICDYCMERWLYRDKQFGRQTTWTEFLTGKPDTVKPVAQKANAPANMVSRKQVMQDLGCNKYLLVKLANAGIIVPVRISRGRHTGRPLNYYSLDDVSKIKEKMTGIPCAHCGKLTGKGAGKNRYCATCRDSGIAATEKRKRIYLQQAEYQARIGRRVCKCSSVIDAGSAA